MKARGAELLVRALEDEGIRHTFGIPGTHTIEIYDAIEQSEHIEPVLVTSELGAAFMADGYARSSRSVGVLTIVPGAGVTMALSGIAEAFMDHVPMVVIATGVRADTGAAYQLHAIEQRRLLEPVCKSIVSIGDASRIYAEVRAACAAARGGVAGPVVVEIPADLLMLVHEVEECRIQDTVADSCEPDQDLLETVATWLGRSNQCVLYLGRGAQEASEDLVVLAEQLGSPVVTTISGKGVFPEDHPLFLWNGWGPQAPSFVSAVVENCDCMLAIGCRFAEVATGSYGAEPPPRLIHVDRDPTVFNRNVQAQLVVESDAKLFVSRLRSQIEGRRPSDTVQARIASGHAEFRTQAARQEDPRKVTPGRLFATLKECCSEDAVYTVDSGNGAFLAMEHLRLTGPRRFLGPVDFSCMGYSIPAAIGAVFSGRKRDVVAIAGDGALLMTGLEMLTGASYRCAPLVVVLRDHKLGQIAQFQKLPLNRETCTKLPDYELEHLARAVGARYFKIIRDAELDTIVPAALSVTRTGEVAVIEACIDGDRKTFFTRGVMKTNFWRLSWSDRLRMLVRALMRRLISD